MQCCKWWLHSESLHFRLYSPRISSNSHFSSRAPYCCCSVRYSSISVHTRNSRVGGRSRDIQGHVFNQINAISSLLAPTTHPRIYRWRWGSALHKIGVNPFASKYLTTHCENLCCLSNHQLLARFCTAKFNFPEKLQFDEYKLENEEQLLQHCTFHAQMIMMQLLHLPRLRMCFDGVPPRDTFNVHLYSSFVTAAATAATNKLHSPYAKWEWTQIRIRTVLYGQLLCHQRNYWWPYWLLWLLLLL